MLTDPEAVFSKKHSWLLGRAMRLCRARPDAEDLVQETFLRLMVACRDGLAFPAEHVCASWLVSTMTNQFYDHLRRRRVREQRAVDPSLGQQLDVPAEPPGRPLWDEVSDERLNGAIDALSPPIRSALVMYVRGRQHREIARELGISPGTVAKRLYDGRAKLRLLLGSRLHRQDH